MGIVNISIDPHKRDLKDNIQTAVDNLDLIIGNIDTTTPEGQAIRKLAQYQRKIIKFIASQIG